MSKNFKKVLATLSAGAMIAMNSIYFVNAAAINNATAVVTPWTWIVVTGAGFWVNGTDTCLATITRTNNNGTTTPITIDSCTVTDGTTLTIAASTVAANQYYTIAFSTSAWTFGTTTAWDTTNNVVVSARVLPILSMAVSNSTVDLWVLSSLVETNSTTDTTITIATNANGGYAVSAAATDFVGATTANVIPFTSRSAQTIGAEGFSIDVASVTQWANGTSTIAAVAWLDTASTYAVANSAANIAWAIAGNAGTTDWDQFVVNYAANISPVTESDNYSTTITYTISWTF